jgi:CelD/BcsL family acetyltransferase involved in cellulose biosynthesis
MVMWAINHGLHRFDFLRGEADYKTQLGSISRCLEDYSFARGLLGRAALQIYQRRGAAIHTARTGLEASTGTRNAIARSESIASSARETHD